MRPVSAVTIFAEPTPLETILQIRPDVLVKGSEYEEADIVGGPEVLSWGGRIVRVPMVAGRSTSQIIAAIRRASCAPRNRSGSHGSWKKKMYQERAICGQRHSPCRKRSGWGRLSTTSRSSAPASI